VESYRSRSGLSVEAARLKHRQHGAVIFDPIKTDLIAVRAGKSCCLPPIPQAHCGYGRCRKRLCKEAPSYQRTLWRPSHAKEFVSTRKRGWLRHGECYITVGPFMPGESNTFPRPGIPRLNFVDPAAGRVAVPAGMIAVKFKLGHNNVRFAARGREPRAELFFVLMECRQQAQATASYFEEIDAPMPPTAKLDAIAARKWECRFRHSRLARNNLPFTRLDNGLLDPDKRSRDHAAR
jgi:hypothetical protein